MIQHRGTKLFGNICCFQYKALQVAFIDSSQSDLGRRLITVFIRMDHIN